MTAAHTTLARRYVTALLAAANAEKVPHSTLVSDLIRLQSAIDTSPAFAALLSSRLIRAENALRAVSDVASHLGVSPVVSGFVRAVVSNGRGAMLGEFILAARTEVDRLSGIQVVDVDVAHPLTPDQTQNLKTVLSAGQTGTDVRLNVHVMPKLLGGMRVRIGSTLIDDTAASKLDRLKQVLKVSGI